MICTLAAVVVTAQTTAPATAPATARSAGQSTPKAALKTPAQALDAGDRQLIFSLLHAQDDQERNLALSTAELAQVTAQLRDAATRQFGADKSRVLGVEPTATPEALARIDSAIESIQGDDATVRPTTSEGPPIALIRRDGIWRVPVSELSKDVEVADIDRNLRDVIEQTRLMRELSKEVSAGKHKTATDARQELDRRILHSTMPTTAPAIAPHAEN
jgi:hypothetical protein